MTECRYLLRFDDICPTMNWKVWEAIEGQLLIHRVRPILAVVPDNRDPNLKIDPPRADFWDRVRQWQAMGFTIALHGYQHVYVNNNPGIMRLTYQSEFAGLPHHEQEIKLRRALAIFAEHGVRADAWVAPSHSFDHNTVSILADLGVQVISDGLWPWPFTDGQRVTWVPQQIWTFRPKRAGVWTVCQHHNAWSARETEQFAQLLAAYASKMTDVPSVLQAYAGRQLTWAARWSAFRDWMWNHRVRPVLAQLRDCVTNE